MAILFGLDIAKIVNDALAAAGGVLDGVLVRETAGERDPAKLTAPRLKTITRHNFKGFLENRSDKYRDGTLIEQGGEMASLLGASLPSGIVPEDGDRIEIEGHSFRINSVPGRDPAAAIYECEISLIGPVAPPVVRKRGAFSRAFSSAFDRVGV